MSDPTGPRPKPPPSRADPNIVGNAEGNRRLIRKDREAIREKLAADHAGPLRLPEQPKETC